MAGRGIVAHPSALSSKCHLAPAASSSALKPNPVAPPAGVSTSLSRHAKPSPLLKLTEKQPGSFKAHAGRAKSGEPYVEPTFVFDIPNQSPSSTPPSSTAPSSTPPSSTPPSSTPSSSLTTPTSSVASPGRLEDLSGAEPSSNGIPQENPETLPREDEGEGQGQHNTSTSTTTTNSSGSSSSGSSTRSQPMGSPRAPARPSAAAAAAAQAAHVAERERERESTFLSLAGPPGPPSAALAEGSFRTGANHKSGYVALIGQPNAGKSTLLNALIGQKLSIVTRKPQTTRHRILGLCSSKDYQIVLYDTPGVIPVVAHKLDDCMMHSVRSATINADCLVLVLDVTLPPQALEQLVQSGGSAIAAVRKKPCLLVLNKKDQLKPGELAAKVQWYTEEAERCLSSHHRRGRSAREDEEESGAPLVLPISAKFGQGMDELLKWCLGNIPLGPAYYPKDVVSELPERFFVAEILREQLLLQYRQEVPYACQVVVRTFKERQLGKDYIAFDIMVERESQRGILLGKGGMALKNLATSARIAIEEFLSREVYLEIVVKVKENWREDEQLLKQFGLNSQSRGDWY